MDTLYLRASVHPRCQRPPKDLGTNKAVEANTAAKHAHKHEARPPLVKNEFRLDSNDSGFNSDHVSKMGGYKQSEREKKKTNKKKKRKKKKKPDVIKVGGYKRNA